MHMVLHRAKEIITLSIIREASEHAGPCLQMKLERNISPMKKQLGLKLEQERQFKKTQRIVTKIWPQRSAPVG